MTNDNTPEDTSRLPESPFARPDDPAADEATEVIPPSQPTPPVAEPFGQQQGWQDDTWTPAAPPPPTAAANPYPPSQPWGATPPPPPPPPVWGASAPTGGQPAGQGGWQPQGAGRRDANPLAALFDFSFSQFATPGLVKIVYILAVVVAVGGWLLSVLTTFGLGAWAGDGAAGIGVMTLLFGWIPALLSIAFTRFVLEGVVALIRITDRVTEIADAQSQQRS